MNKLMDMFKKYLIVNEHGREVTTGDVKALFGKPRNEAWPETGMMGRVIQGTFCWVYPLRKGEGFKLRAYCSCRFCGKAVAIGRLRQHVQMHSNDEACVLRAKNEVQAQ